MPAQTFANMRWDFDESCIPWEGGQKTYALWTSKLKDERLPARHDFKPQELSASVLPTIMLVDVTNHPTYFTVRLAGTGIVQVMDRDPTGMDVASLRGGDVLQARFTALLDAAQPYLALDRPTPWRHKDHPTYHVVALPLARDGENIDMLMLNLHFPGAVKD